jgi:DNA-binding NtrC family response regulator
MSASVLVVDDEPTTQEALGRYLQAEGYRVATAGSGQEALARIGEREFDAVVTDILMPGVSGLEVLERSRALNPRAAVILMTGHPSVETVLEALRKGACDYLEKPFLLEDLARCLRRLLRDQTACRETRVVPRALRSPGADEIVGESPAILTVKRQIARCAPTGTTVLITGESGTGKELVARAIHASSPRRDRPFVPVNCGAIPEALLESQLFGHVKGAFTSAVQANPGLFVAADTGTLFLDEIAELPFPLQVKLLRVIEEKQVWPVGATRPLPVDVRIVASTNRDLPREVEAGRFRPDLFYRLNVVHLELPPLRERAGDVRLLVDHFIRRLNGTLNRRLLGVEREALRALVSHGWKGNIRELENVLHRAMILSEGDVLGLHHLPPEVAAPAASRPVRLREAVRRFERQHVLDALTEARLDKREAARRLGISLASLYRKLSVEPPDGTAPG